MSIFKRRKYVYHYIIEYTKGDDKYKMDGVLTGRRRILSLDGYGDAKQTICDTFDIERGKAIIASLSYLGRRW